MPIIDQRPLVPEGTLGLWQIEEAEDWFLDKIHLSAAEQAQLKQIRGRRRVEWLAVRQLVHDLSGRDERGPLVKDDFGKPHLENSDWQISVSHSGDLAAAIAAPNAVGVDIQRIVAKIGRLKHKFLSEQELATLTEANAIERLHVYWCIKEALYKAYGRRELDFCRHLQVGPFEVGNKVQRTRGWVRKDGMELSFDVRFQRVHEEYMLAFVQAVAL